MLSENKFHPTLKKNDKYSMIAFKPEMIIQEDRLRDAVKNVLAEFVR